MGQDIGYEAPVSESLTRENNRLWKFSCWQNRVEVTVSSPSFRWLHNLSRNKTLDLWIHMFIFPVCICAWTSSTIAEIYDGLDLVLKEDCLLVCIADFIISSLLWSMLSFSWFYLVTYLANVLVKFW